MTFFTLLSDQAFALPASSHSNLRAGSPPHTRLEKRWWMFGAPLAIRRVHAQVFHGTNFEVPYLNLRPSVVTLHDLSPWKNPHWHHRAHRVRTRTPWLLRLGIATAVITPSESIRKEAINYFDLPPERVTSIPLGPVPLPEPEAPFTHPRPFFLFVGALEPRKNLELLVDVWRSVRDHGADLLLVGRRREDGPQFAAEPGLFLLGEVSDSQLAALYRAAVALVFPSFYEGFGLPVLEAMQCGAATLISGDPALGELGGDAALRFHTPADLAGAMIALLTQPELRARHQAKSRRRAALYSWSECARGTRAVYGEAIARFG